ncbi:MAG: FG-GAP-like repeat-containing protein, partial [Bacteroidota bacterium]
MLPSPRFSLRVPAWVFALCLVGTAAVPAQPFSDAVVEFTGTPGNNVAWMDVDNDGDQDLVLTNFFLRPIDRGGRVLLNNGDGSFTRVENTAFADLQLQTNAAAAADYDNDGDDDLFLSNANHVGDIDLTTGSTLWRNEGGTFALISDGPLAAENDLGGFGTAWGDYDADGDLDLFVSVHENFSRDPDDSQGNNQLFDNNGDGTFTPNSTALPVTVGAGPNAMSGWIDFDDD